MQAKADVDKQLIESFKKIALEVPISKITIKDITDGAGVIRPTFYNHFQDKYEVIERIIRTELLDPMRPLLQNEMFDEAILLIFTNILKEKELYKKLSKMEGQNSFEDIVRDCIRDILLELLVDKIGTKTAKHKWMTPDKLADYYSLSMTFIVMTWIQTDMVIPPKEVAEVYNYVISKSLKDMVEDIAEWKQP